MPISPRASGGSGVPLPRPPTPTTRAAAARVTANRSIDGQHKSSILGQVTAIASETCRAPTKRSPAGEERMSQQAVKRLYLMQVGSMPEYQIPIVCYLVQT